MPALGGLLESKICRARRPGARGNQVTTGVVKIQMMEFTEYAMGIFT